ncbi:MAG: shikimate dehydrogenase [Candidatus Nanopelagicales bacterium]
MIRRAAVVGSPIAHSLSPALHTAAYRALGLDWQYTAIEVTPQRLPDFVDSLDATWAGLSLTMPLKVAVLDLAREVDPSAATTVSANTLLLPGRQAFNTDVLGLAVALQRAGFSEGPGFSATVIGAGATARSAIASMQQLGAREVHVMARRPEAATETRRVGEKVGVPVEIHAFTDVGLLGAPVVVSTVPAGVADVFTGGLPGVPGWLLDVVYAPWPTALARAWAAAGGTPVSGLEMLLAQAERQVELMTGRPAPTSAMRTVLPDVRS